MTTEQEPTLRRPDIPGKAGLLDWTFVPFNAAFYKTWVTENQALQELIRLQSMSVQERLVKGAIPEYKTLYIARYTSQELSPEDFLQMAGQNLDIYLLINFQHRKTYPSKAVKLISYHAPLEEVHRFFTHEEMEPNFQQGKNTLSDHWGNILFAHSLIAQTAVDPETGLPTDAAKLNEIANENSVDLDQNTLKQAFRDLAGKGFFEYLVSHGLAKPEEKEAYYKQISAWLLNLSSARHTRMTLLLDLPFPLSLDAGEDKSDLEFLPYIAQMTFAFCQLNRSALTEAGAMQSVSQNLQKFYVRAVQRHIGEELGQPAENFKDSYPKLKEKEPEMAQRVFEVVQCVNAIVQKFKSLSVYPRI